MKTIHCIRKTLHVGALYLRAGETATVSDEQSAKLIAAKHAEEVAKPAKGGK